MKITKYYGPPGTGKTTTLISTVLKELESGVPITEIAYLTHTRAGAAEVRKRIGEQFSGQDPLELLWFRTIHSACCKMTGIGRKETISLTHYKMFGERYNYSVGNNGLDPDKDWDWALNIINLASAQMRSVDEILKEQKRPCKAFKLFLEKWLEFKNDLGVLDFTDQLNAYKGTPAPVKVMFVDEAQDLSKKQWEIIFGLAGNCERMYVAGDDDQSIYSFIGADEYGFLDLEADEEIILTDSYRVPGNIGKYAEEIISKNKKRKKKDITWSDHDGSIKLLGSYEHFDFDVTEDTFVLCRHNKQCREVSKYLKRRGIAHSINNESLLTDDKAYIAKAYLMLSIGERANIKHVIGLTEHLKEHELSKQLRRLYRLGIKYAEPHHVKELQLDRGDWVDYISNNKYERQYFAELEELIKRYQSLDVIGKKPLVHVMTYHYSKGREADNVICLTDVYGVVWDSLKKTPDLERRLAYVGVTRTRKNLFIVRPQTDWYLTPLKIFWSRKRGTTYA